MKEIYLKTGSRGKKQRVKKKLKALGFNQPIVMTNKNPSMMKKSNQNGNSNNSDGKFLATKLEINASNYNQKFKDSNKKHKEDKMLKNKRGREEEKSFKEGVKSNKKNGQNHKNQKQEKFDKKNDKNSRIKTLM